MKYLLLFLLIYLASCAPVRFSTQAEREKAAEEMFARLGIAPAPVRSLGTVESPAFPGQIPSENPPPYVQDSMIEVSHNNLLQPLERSAK